MGITRQPLFVILARYPVMVNTLSLNSSEREASFAIVEQRVYHLPRHVLSELIRRRVRRESTRKPQPVTMCIITTFGTVSVAVEKSMMH
jgi:hypothetical protein